jgi:putative ABC transport system permease protein
MLQLDNSLLIGGWASPPELLWVPALACVVSLAAAVAPTVGAYRVSVLELLQGK